MRIEYNEDNRLRMYSDNDTEFDIMRRICKEIFGHILSSYENYRYEYYCENGIVIAYSYETELIKIIEKMKNDRIERLLQIRHEGKLIRFVARVMIELLG